MTEEDVLLDSQIYGAVMALRAPVKVTYTGDFFEDGKRRYVVVPVSCVGANSAHVFRHYVLYFSEDLQDVIRWCSQFHAKVQEFDFMLPDTFDVDDEFTGFGKKLRKEDSTDAACKKIFLKEETDEND